MNQISMGGFTRITKRKAKSLFYAGKTIYLQRVNFQPVNVWSNCMPLNKDTTINTFSVNVSEFEYYNCIDSQTGRYAAFYIKN